MVKGKGSSLIFLVSVSFVILFVGLLPVATTYAKGSQTTNQLTAKVPLLGNYSSPSWWNGKTCDSGNHPGAYLLTSWRGIQVCGPLPGNVSNYVDHFSVNGAGADQYEFMCTDLVARYLLAAYGLKSQVADGWQIVNTYTALPNSPFHKVNNDGKIHMAPIEGDVLSYGTSGPGHTSIVIGSSVNGSGNGSINVIEQNVETSGRATLTMANWVIQYDPYHIGTVASWMTTRAVPISVNFSVTMPGIGNTSGNNNSPRHWQRVATVKIFNGAGSVIQTVSPTVTYSSISGVYSGSVTLSLPTGSYTASVKLSNSLSKVLPGFFTTPSATWSPPTIALVSGDINGDNVLDILDYNDLLSCYGSKFPTCQFNPSADLDDNGSVDGVDYNIWLRDMQTQHGG